MTRLWDGERFLPRDVCTGRLIDRRTILSLGPLLDPQLPGEVAAALAAELESPHFGVPGGLGVTSSGPVWANLNWLLARGLRQHGLVREATDLERTTLGLVERSGIREYFDPVTGDGLGAEDFSWTAAAVIDILRA